jgi:hypothetical protein
MLQIQTPPTIEQVKHLACQLSQQDRITLINELQSQIEAEAISEDQSLRQAAAKLSEPSFAAVWDNEADAIYDDHTDYTETGKTSGTDRETVASNSSPSSITRIEH